VEREIWVLIAGLGDAVDHVVHEYRNFLVFRVSPAESHRSTGHHQVSLSTHVGCARERVDEKKGSIFWGAKKKSFLLNGVRHFRVYADSVGEVHRSSLHDQLVSLETCQPGFRFVWQVRFDTCVRQKRAKIFAAKFLIKKRRRTSAAPGSAHLYFYKLSKFIISDEKWACVVGRVTILGEFSPSG
jgi:hypothetical protein